MSHLTDPVTEEDAALTVSRAVKNMLKDLNTGYVDLLLMHWPGKGSNAKNCKNSCTVIGDNGWQKRRLWVWKAMEAQLANGSTRSLGVANFNSLQLRHLMSNSRMPPSVNQIEWHPFWHDESIRNTCSRLNITVVAYRPLGGHQSISRLSKLPLVRRLEEKYERSWSQIVLRWATQQRIP
eukprot:8440980-Pyramimonas_sp.AAC.1